jgi:hypothetical protein
VVNNARPTGPWHKGLYNPATAIGFPQEYDMGRTIARANTRSLADGIGKRSRNHMATQFCLMNGPACGVGADIALVHASHVTATHRESVAGTKALPSSDNLIPLTHNAARKDQVELAALPMIALVFTVAGPLVYERGSGQLR